jgi:hypothetical protein
MYLVSDILQELKDNGIVVTRQAIDAVKRNKNFKPDTHYKQTKKGAIVLFTPRGRTKILKHFKVYKTEK